MKNMIVEYYTSVRKKCGWRQVKVRATVKPITAKTAIVISAEIEDKLQSKNSEYDREFWQDMEVGKKKRISAMDIIDEVAS